MLKAKLSKGKTILAFLGLLLSVSMTFLGLYLLFDQVLKDESEYLAALISALITLVVAYLSSVYSKHLESKLRIFESAREKKILMYEKLLSTWMIPTFFTETSDEKGAVTALIEFTPQLILWSSKNTFRKFNKLMEKAREMGPISNPSIQQQYDMLFLYASFLRSMREEIGYGDKEVREEDILTLIVSNKSSDPVLEAMMANHLSTLK